MLCGRCSVLLLFDVVVVCCWCLMLCVLCFLFVVVVCCRCHCWCCRCMLSLFVVVCCFRCWLRFGMCCVSVVGVVVNVSLLFDAWSLRGLLLLLFARLVVVCVLLS